MKKHLFVFMGIGVIFLMGIVFHTGCKEEKVFENPLPGIAWILESIRYSDQNIVDIDDTYRMVFNEDNTLEVKTDCNFCKGSYDIGSEGTIYFYTPLSCTEAFCGPDSREREFHRALDDVFEYEKEGNRLRLYFSESGSRMNFIAE